MAWGMYLSRAFLAGVLGAAVLSLVAFVARALGFPFGFEMLLGSWVTGSVGYVTWLVGLVLHFVIGGLLGVVYAILFRWLGFAGARVGVLISVVHLMVAGFLLSGIPPLHPTVPEVIAPPGVFMSGLGPLGVALFVIAHIVFGAIVGGAYRRSTYARVVTVRQRVTSYP